MKDRGNGWLALGFKSYQDYLNSWQWKEKRYWIIQVQGNKCQRCGTLKDLEVHHLSYYNVGNEDCRDVIVLCKRCHAKENKKGIKQNKIDENKND